MTPILVDRLVDAPADRVFKTVADITWFSQAVPRIVKVDFLSDTKTGIGTRFRETRLMNGKPAITELEVTEYKQNERVRIVADSHGTVWDTLFIVSPESARTKLTLAMEARAHKLLPSLINPLIRGAIKKAVEQDMDSVKAFCER